MGIASEKSNTVSGGTTTAKTTKVPDVTNKTLTEAKKTLENLGFKVVVPETQNANSVLVTEQVPAKGQQVLDGSHVVLYTEESNVRTSVKVPNLVRKNTARSKSSSSRFEIKYNIYRKWKSKKPR